MVYLETNDEMEQLKHFLINYYEPILSILELNTLKGVSPFSDLEMSEETALLKQQQLEEKNQKKKEHKEKIQHLIRLSQPKQPGHKSKVWQSNLN